MESFMKEGAGGDDLSIGVKLPNGEFDLPISKNLYLVPGITLVNSGAFRTQWNIYDGAFFAQIINVFYSFTLMVRKFHRVCSTEF